MNAAHLSLLRIAQQNTCNLANKALLNHSVHHTQRNKGEHESFSAGMQVCFRNQDGEHLDTARGQ